MRSEHPEILFAAATLSDDEEAIASWKDKVGADFPILRGLAEASAKAYGIDDYPAFRVVGKDGMLLGSDEAALKKAVGEG